MCCAATDQLAGPVYQAMIELLDRYFAVQEPLRITSPAARPAFCKSSII